VDRARLRRVLALTVASAGCVPACAALSAGERIDWYTQIDNDVAFATDRWYTSGVRIARVSRGIEWGLTQEIYTPDARRSEPGVPDRSPAGRLLLSVARHFQEASAFQTLGVAAGVRGPAALGRQTTETVHHVVTAPDVDWSRQLPNRYDLQGVWTRTRRFQPASLPGEGFKLHFGAVLGNQVAFAHAGAEYRIGAPGARTRSSALLRLAPTPPMGDGGEAARGWSAYAGLSVRGVARNELLVRDYDPAMPELNLRRAVGRFAAGIGYAMDAGSVDFAVAHDTLEWSGQHTSSRFGSLTLHVAF
jgi:lipid A 3-O-deacylase